MKKVRESHLNQLSKYHIFLEALRRNEGFRRETDKAFAKFWEREGDSLRKMELVERDANGNTSSSTLLGELNEKPDSDLHVLDVYCHSPEAHHVRRKYGLIRPYHYNQPGIPCPREETIVSLVNADEFPGNVGSQNVWISRYPCLQGIRNQSLSSMDIRIDLSCPKQDIMSIFEIVLDNALQERQRVGKRTKTRGLALDYFPFRVWDMHKKEGKSPWRITQELNPRLQTLTAKGCTRKKCPEKLEFQTLTNKKKETYNNKYCGKKDSCLIAKALLKNVSDAIAKAEKQIASISPIN
jgi:hypothetical protein